jgi:serine/threonine protein kinase
MNVTMASMLDTGNLVLLNGSNSIVWQSFDSPTDTLLPNQTYSVKNNVTMYGWQKTGVWTPSNYSLGWGGWSVVNVTYQSPRGLGLLSLAWTTPDNRNLWYNYSTETLTFWSPRTDYSLTVLSEDGELRGLNSSGKYEVVANSTDMGSQGRLRRLTLDVDGNWRMYSWFPGSSTQWSVVWTAVSDSCDVMGFCGPFAICESGVCLCPAGFKFINATDTSQGCERIDPLASSCVGNATDGQGFPDTLMKMTGIDYPYGGDYQFFSSVSTDYCVQQCINNCLCQAAAASNPQSNGNISCYHKKFTLVNGRLSSSTTTYIRVGHHTDHSGLSPRTKLLIVVSTMGPFAFIVGMISCLLGCSFLRKEIRVSQHERLEKKRRSRHGAVVVFTYAEIRLMTEDFKEEIGNGGCGTVFRGEILGKSDKEIVAVKRLKKLDAGEKDFVNEMGTIGCIHHVNLVHLVGYCAEGKHRILVYEYMERLSLDKSLFLRENAKLPVLEWRARFRIAVETAKALAYLHNAVREQRIIHCDIKPENILLDSTCTAKVADFGLSRILGPEKTRTVTMQVRGTLGYLAPELVSNQTITPKVDVYSFGMVLLEIVGGRRNLKVAPAAGDDTGDTDDPERYYPAWAFSKLQEPDSESAILEVLDPLLTGIADIAEVQRCLQVAIWCINDRPSVRPPMNKVVHMLEGYATIDLPVPRPEFFDDLTILLPSQGDTNTEQFSPSPRTLTSTSPSQSPEFTPDSTISLSTPKHTFSGDIQRYYETRP